MNHIYVWTASGSRAPHVTHIYVCRPLPGLADAARRRISYFPSDVHPASAPTPEGVFKPSAVTAPALQRLLMEAQCRCSSQSGVRATALTPLASGLRSRVNVY